MTIRIGEVARRAGIATSAIRYYEREGLIPRADRQGNARVYGPDILERLALIELAKTAVRHVPPHERRGRDQNLGEKHGNERAHDRSALRSGEDTAGGKDADATGAECVTSAILSLTQVQDKGK